jgi:hypothetical protein
MMKRMKEMTVDITVINYTLAEDAGFLANQCE